MNKENEEFEGFLRQFRLRGPGVLTEGEPDVDFGKAHPIRRWMLVAAAVVLVAPLAVLLSRYLPTAPGPYATVEAAGYAPYEVGEKVGAGRPIRSSSVDSAVLGLEDGSRIEMRSESQLSLEAAEDGVRVHLNEGSIIVRAVEQRTGHLYIQTKDATVAVVGTVFFVGVEPAGTRVAVIQGDVRVQQGSDVKDLRSGEQIGTASSLALRPVENEIAWSRNAGAHIALLQQQKGTAEVTRPQPEADRRRVRIQEPSTTLQAGRVGRAVARLQQNSPAVEPPAPTPTPQPEPTPPPEQKPPAAALPDGPGKQILERACGSCHAVDVVRSAQYPTREEYANLVARQIAMGAGVSETERSVLIDYLFALLGRPIRYR